MDVRIVWTPSLFPVLICHAWLDPLPPLRPGHPSWTAPKLCSPKMVDSDENSDQRGAVKQNLFEQFFSGRQLASATGNWLGIFRSHGQFDKSLLLSDLFLLFKGLTYFLLKWLTYSAHCLVPTYIFILTIEIDSAENFTLYFRYIFFLLLCFNTLKIKLAVNEKLLKE